MSSIRTKRKYIIFVVAFIVGSLICSMSVVDVCEKDTLQNHPILVIFFGCIICFLFKLVNRNERSYLLILYSIFIIYETLLFRSYVNHSFDLVLFRTYSQFWESYSTRVEIIENIWLFIPYSVGVFYVCKSRKLTILALSVPFVIEIIQGFSHCGLFEIDDLLSNFSGELIGYWIYMIVRSKSFMRRHSIHHRKNHRCHRKAYVTR